MSANESGVKRAGDGKFIVPPKSPGRPVGARNKLGEAFVADMLADWREHGAATIVKVRDEKPDQYLKVVASILPKELNLRVSDFEDMTDDDLARELASIASQLAGAASADRQRIADKAAGAILPQQSAEVH